ncbi:tyrosine-type recombinase/integrase [Planctomycetota bacterium]
MAKRKKAKKRGGLAPDKYLSDAQLKKLRKYVKDKADLARMRAGSRGVIDEMIVELLVNTGLRASELCSLNIGDLPVKHGKDCIWVRDGKGKVSRTVDISNKLKKRIERFVKLYRKGARANSALLVSERGDRIIYRSIYAKVKRIGEQAGIGKLHPHMLRHTYLTRLYNVEKDLRFVQDQAGHASPTTTAIYAKTNNKARRRQVQALDEEEF